MPRNGRGPSDQPLRAAAVPDGRMSLENLGLNRLTKNRRSSNMGKGDGQTDQTGVLAPDGGRLPANAASKCAHSNAPPAIGPNRFRCRWIP